MSKDKNRPPQTKGQALYSVEPYVQWYHWLKKNSSKGIVCVVVIAEVPFRISELNYHYIYNKHATKSFQNSVHKASVELF